LKELSYLNKYIYKYKFYYLIGSFFILISTFFAILPATLIRETFNIIEEGYSLYILNEDVDLKKMFLKIFYFILLVLF
jgi:ATP-binding cassette subfamily B protein